MKYTPRLKKKYQSEIINNLKSHYKSVMEVPKLIKISLNHGVGNNSSDKKFIDTAQQEMSAIAGQKAIITKSKKDISNFKVRKGMPVGIMVTLRGDRMYEFLDRLLSATLPRVRDFKGVPRTGFDGRGNYTLGIKEHIVFQEIDLDKINKITGMDITIVTDTDSDDDAYTLLKEFGMPFSNNGNLDKKESKETKDNKIEKEISDTDNLDTTQDIIEDIKDGEISEEDDNQEEINENDSKEIK